MKKRTYSRSITAVELRSWLLHEDRDVLAFNKPGDVVCHPSKDGPCSSLAGAVREHFSLPAAHLVFRLDRETSGVVLFARNRETARKLQGAMEARSAHKNYLAVLSGDLAAETLVDQPLGPDEASPVLAKSAVRAGGRPSVTRFTPLSRAGGFTLARVTTLTGRKHQIRAHALWLGTPLAGDKIYGPDPRLFLEFIETGWTPALQEKLPLQRQALHCSEIDLRAAGLDKKLFAPLPPDLRAFCSARGLPVPEGA